MVLEVVARRLPIHRRLVAVEVVSVRDAAVDRGNAVIEVVGVDRRTVRQQRCRGAGDSAGQAVPDIVIAVGDSAIRPRFLGQLALVIVGVIGRGIAGVGSALGDAGTLAVEP